MNNVGFSVLTVVIVFALFFFEIRSIYQDRDIHDKEQVAAKAREEKASKDIARAIKDAVGSRYNSYAKAIVMPPCRKVPLIGKSVLLLSNQDRQNAVTACRCHPNKTTLVSNDSSWDIPIDCRRLLKEKVANSSPTR